MRWRYSGDDDSDGAAVDSDDGAVELQWQAITGIIIIFLLPRWCGAALPFALPFRVLQHGVELSESLRNRDRGRRQQQRFHEYLAHKP